MILSMLIELLDNYSHRLVSKSVGLGFPKASTLLSTLIRGSLLLQLNLAVVAAEPRTWTSADGSKTFDGELESYDAETGVVTVNLPNGNKISFTQDNLSEADIAPEQQLTPVDAPTGVPPKGPSHCPSTSADLPRRLLRRKAKK